MKNWKKWLSTALFAAMIALLAWYIVKNREQLGRLLTLDAATIGWILVLALGGCVLNCVYHKLILDTYRVPLDVTDWMGVVFVANAMAYVLPLRMDLVFTAAYYKRTKGLAYVKSASMAAGNIVFSILFALLQMFAALLLTGLMKGVWPGLLWLIWLIGAAGTAVFLVLALWFRDRMPGFLSRIQVVRKVVDGFCVLLCNRKLLCRLLCCLILNNILHLLLFMACFRGVGMAVTLDQALLYNSISRMLSLVAIVPGNIGIQQGVMGVAGALVGDLFEQGVMVSLLQSAALMAIYLIAGLLFAYPVYRRIQGLRP